MNAKQAKWLRREVRLALPTDYTRDTHYLINRKTGQKRLGKCYRGLYQHLKRRIKLANRSPDYS